MRTVIYNKRKLRLTVGEMVNDGKKSKRIDSILYLAPEVRVNFEDGQFWRIFDFNEIRG